MTINCEICGFDANPEGATYCEACGSELPVTSTATPSMPVNNDYTPTPPLTQIMDTSIPVSISPIPQSPPSWEEESPTIRVSPGYQNPSVMPPQPITPPIPPVNSGIMGIAKLVAKQPDYPKSEFQLSSSQSTIVGRFDDTTGPVDIDLSGFPDDDTISRNHAEIYFEGNQWKIKPISTTNGTFVKKFGESRFGGKITLPEIINNGDEIAFAKIRFIFQVS